MIQQAIAQVMGLIFDPLFSESSCGFRPGRSAHFHRCSLISFSMISTRNWKDAATILSGMQDFIIVVKSLRAGNRVMASIRRFLERELRLQVNEKKSKVAPVEECGFLGFVFVKGKIRWSDKYFLEFKRRLRLFTGRSWFVSMEYRYNYWHYARLDELLRNIGVLSTDPGIRRMAPPPDTDVLLETVALCPDQSSQPSQTGNFQKTSHHDSD
jgi:hypothetical protein